MEKGEAVSEDAGRRAAAHCLHRGVHNVGRLTREGMRQTDRTILEIMMNN